MSDPSTSFDVTFYRCTDTHGNTWSGFVEENCDTIQVCSLFDSNRDPIYFESEFYHLPTWCRASNVKLDIVRKTITIDFDKESQS